MDRQRKWNMALFALYLLLMGVLLFHRTVPEGELSYWEQLGRRINLQPLKTIRLFLVLLDHPRFRRDAIVNLVGNVVMFLPLGMLLPRVFQKKPRLWKPLLTAALMILAVEIAQMLTLLGTCDVDDLILNLAGTALGYGLFRLTGKEKED